MNIIDLLVTLIKHKSNFDSVLSAAGYEYIFRKLKHICIYPHEKAIG